MIGFSVKRYFEIRVCPRPEERNARHPIFPVNRMPGALVFVRGEDARSRRDFPTRDLSANGAGRDLDAGIVPDALRLAHIVSSHHIELSVLFAEPYRCGNSCTRFAKSRQRNVLLAVNGGRNRARHGNILAIRTQHFGAQHSEGLHSEC